MRLLLVRLAMTASRDGHKEVAFLYKRHGPQSLIANLEVATGQVVAHSIGLTRTEADFAAHIEQTLQTDPEAAWIFITDQPKQFLVQSD